MFKECTVLNKSTGEIFLGQVDTELEHLKSYPYREATLQEIENKDYLKVEDGEIIVDIAKKLQDLKVKAHEINTEKHIEFQSKPFQFEVTRDDNSTITMTLDCSDNTCFNIERAIKVAQEQDNTPFYDGLGIGSDKRWSVAELMQVYMAVQNRLSPSFDIKGQNKLAINIATTVEELQTIIENISY